MSNLMWLIGLIAIVSFLSVSDAVTCKNVVGPICGDCNTLWTCLGGNVPYRTQSCEKSYPGQPYCIDGACRSTPDPNDDQCLKTGITCTGKGYFPNPLNCSQYFFCEGAKGKSASYECPSGFVYNSMARECRRRVVASDCRTVNCDSNADQYVAYPGDSSYYALCPVVDGSTIPDAFRCPEGEQFVQSQHQCAFQCKKEGRAVDGRDCGKYYECFRNGLNYIILHQKCLTGFIFDSEENGCVEGTCPVEPENGSDGDGDAKD